jgi:hypothetical protein
MIFESESDKIIEIVSKSFGLMKSKDLQKLLSAGRKTRSIGYDEKSKGITQRYSGNQQNLLKKALEKRYPRTFDKMPIDPVNWIKFFAVQDSGVYENPAKRTLVDLSGQELDSTDERAMMFKTALDELVIESQLKAMERRANTGIHASVIAISNRIIDGVSKIVSNLYWTHEVVALAHSAAPDDADALYFVALKQDENYKGSSIWQVWTRDFSEDTGQLKFGNWSYRRVSEEGDFSTPPQEYFGRLPIAFLSTEIKSTFWPDLDEDVSLNVDNLNIVRSNRQHVIDMQAHGMRIYRGVQRETSEIESGPDSIMQIGANEFLDAINFNANHEAIEASATRDLNELGVSRGNSPDAYAVKPIVTQSGIAKVIANAPHAQRIEDQKNFYVAFEQNQLLPIILDVIEFYDPRFSGSFIDVMPKVELGRKTIFEDDKILADRVQIMRNMKVIDRADARVMLKLSSDRATALKEIAEVDKDEKALLQLLGDSVQTNSGGNTNGQENFDSTNGASSE